MRRVSLRLFSMHTQLNCVLYDNIRAGVLFARWYSVESVEHLNMIVAQVQKEQRYWKGQYDT